MLFTYDSAATTENWLHGCVVSMIKTLHQDLDTGLAPTEWPAIIPNKYREKLRPKWGLRKKIYAYAAAVSQLNPKDRRKISDFICKQNRIETLCGNKTNCEDLTKLPNACHKPIDDLFQHSFKLLTALRIRDTQYSKIYEKLKAHVCPFCGCESLDAPGQHREDLDHYLLIDKYPLAGVNLRNLVPMGSKCNKLYKHKADVLWDSNGNRREVFYPYGAKSSSISLMNSVPFKGKDKKLPKWQISFSPNTPSCEAWDSIFKIRKRLTNNVLDVSFSRWLEDFSAWYKMDKKKGGQNTSTMEIALSCYAETLETHGITPCDFLRAPVFRMLYQHYTEGNQRLQSHLQTLVTLD
jgi:hypothetical protein